MKKHHRESGKNYRTRGKLEVVRQIPGSNCTTEADLSAGPTKEMKRLKAKIATLEALKRHPHVLCLVQSRQGWHDFLETGYIITSPGMNRSLSDV